MRNTLKLLALILVLLIPDATPTRAQEAVKENAVVPLTPAELIKYLPATPSGWQLKESKAKGVFMDWMSTVASREFDRHPAVAPGLAAPPVEVTRIKITDTGGWPAFLGAFGNFKVGKYGNEESLLINGLPARKNVSATGGRMQVLVKNRFIVQVEIMNQTAEALSQNFRLIDLSAIVAIQGSNVHQLPNPIPLIGLDELDPSANTVSQAQWMTKEAMQAAAERPPPQ